MDSDELYQIPILAEIIESSLPLGQAKDVSVLKHRDQFSVTLSKDINKQPDFIIPETGPERSGFITAIQWSDRPKCNSYESYFIGTNSTSTHWLLWRFTADLLEPTENGSISIAAFMEAGDIQQRDAAILMLENLWRNETSNSWFVPGVVHFSKSPILTFEAIYKIMDCSLEEKEDKRIWREGQPNNVFDLHGDPNFIEEETEEEEIKKVLEFMRSMHIDVPDGVEDALKQIGKANMMAIMDHAMAKAAESTFGPNHPMTLVAYKRAADSDAQFQQWRKDNERDAL